MTVLARSTPSAARALGIVLQRRRTSAATALLGAVLIASLAGAMCIGSVSIPLAEVWGILHAQLRGVESASSAADTAIVWNIRLPRAVLGAVVGAGLAVCGMAMQAMVRNELADPFLLGINSGASTGAAAAILFGVGAGLGAIALPGSAFVGALAAGVLAFVIAHTAGRLTSTRLLLAGITVGYLLTAATSFLVFAAGSAEGARSVMFWLLGSLSLAAWDGLLVAALVVVASTTVLFTLAGRRFDALAIGDETMMGLGLSPQRLRVILLVLVSLCVGVLVSVAGSIGFVGLVVPHLARRMVGAAHSRAFPVAALLGAVLLVWADVLARIVLAPQELPIGIVTAVIGAPFLIALIARTRSVA